MAAIFANGLLQNTANWNFFCDESEWALDPNVPSTVIQEFWMIKHLPAGPRKQKVSASLCTIPLDYKAGFSGGQAEAVTLTATHTQGDIKYGWVDIVQLAKDDSAQTDATKSQTVSNADTFTYWINGALCEHLSKKPGLFFDEMAVFLWDRFRTQVTTSSIKRALVAKDWSRKSTWQQARERNAHLREWYLHDLLDFLSYQLAYIDESGCDKRVGFRRTGWSPLGASPLQVSHFHCDERYQILPAYIQDGIVSSLVFRKPTDATVLEDFIAQLLQHCGRSEDGPSLKPF
ncbi:uncharacterized protein N7506_001843 [Penicillium brevicompactum]|uniref:uncharacterized protein n=1 Tax=Penicillium brevicompactum TaxID=5074 RepID=UPI002542412E|nr:uncharacterized protein N7506_001843 [Penicillium brevicompactum]KAJ5348590.1 hypothetical protein N7506_001843 [Penicillium brevicompactum]